MMLHRSLTGVLGLGKQSKSKWRNFLPAFLSTKSDNIEDMQNTLGQQVWNASIKKFQDLGFSLKQSTSMLFNNPALSSYPAERLCHHFEVLSSIGFKTEEIRDVLAREPKIFDRDFQVLKRNHSNLLRQMGDHQGRIAAIGAPNTLIDNSFITNQKIDYCIMEMMMNKPKIAKSRILQCSYSLIKTRHMFAYRSGLYKKIDPKNKEGLINNPSIPDLFFCSDEIFLTLFKGFTIEDYVVFDSLMTSEEDHISDEDEMDSNDHTDGDNSEDEKDSGGSYKNRYSARRNK
ncbi:transcription termination factor 4, mitochondrial-like [Daphnia carinata]|uniref:transcription termination factor 4, mitochondrial-like n=1 Tax=Daphnia carinata TaxID=120202 RepID=UPI0025805EA1|nr:transcription termination factor 4, mitochondrial-like [Daphnia carinata]XP_057364530.1 transcription termination factor 4, mitochondrial-like [Daphnia carinata]XP_057364531.1 transcription termination factor 4, mitochondrial-like [Daphnia carinata]XP_057364532.1 transcription termination factor 4, mitochondrial-like [Daphnia carinata]XP_059350429.1 transcription termination factor 4, mitochondrial-like [Daphnia carinata]